MTRATAIATVIVMALGLRLPTLRGQTPEELSITPTRLIFTDAARETQSLTLRNRGNDTLYYDLYIANYRMSDTGTFEELSEPDSGQMFADTFVKFAPKELVIAPNGERGVKVTYARGDRAVGEYRSHLVIRLARRARAVPRPEDDDDPGYGVAVPILVRQGVLAASVTVSYLNIDLVPTDQGGRTQAVASVRLERSGNASTYGDVSIWYVKTGGSPVLLGSARGIALYTPNRLRFLRIPLQLPDGAALQAGVLRLEYRDRTGPDGVLLAQIEVPVE